MPIVIDDATLSFVEKVATAIGSAIVFIGGYLLKKGYIDIWLTKLFTSTEVIHAVKRQNGHALTKLNMSDELVDYLQKLAPSADGTIDEEAAIQVLRDCIKWNNHIIKKIPHVDEVKK